MENKVIGFIGLGNMASAIIGGMLQKEVVKAFLNRKYMR